MATRSFSAILGVAWLLQIVEGKVQSGTLSIGGAEAEHRWHYVSKFGFGLGIGEYEIRLRLRLRDALVNGQVGRLSTTQLQLEAFLDEDWARAESLSVCRRAQDAPARASIALQPGSRGDWGPWHGGQVSHVVRSHIWYFAISSCYARSGAVPLELEYEIRMRQSDDSELSVEMAYMPAVSFFALVFLTLFTSAFATRCAKYRRTTGQLHTVVYILACALVLQWATEAFNTVYFFSYRRHGFGRPLLDGFAEACFVLSQVLCCGLLLAISQGYTLRRSTSSTPTLNRLMLGALVAIHVVLVAADKVEGDTSSKHHEHDGTLGWLLPTVRIALYGCFISGIQAMRKKGGFKLQNFLQRFQCAGSVYLLSHPVIFIFAQLFAPYLQHPIMEVGMLLMQTTSAIWLTDLFLSRGAYYEVSQLSSSLLPGSTSGSLALGFGKDD